MAISAQDVKTLRDRTGAGMGDCKKALEETGGDMDAAIEILRKKGAATASKRADKEANEGVVATATTADNSSAAIVEVNCETDFVARNEEFSSFVRSLAGHVLATKPASIEALLASEVNGVAVQNQLNDLLAKFNERIEIRRFEIVETSGGYVADYVHNGDKLGVLVEFGGASEGLGTVGRDVAMQVAAMNPGYVRREEVPADVLTKEREIYAEQMRNEGKPEAIIEKIVTGRLEKYYADNVLLEQSFVKDSAKAVNEIIGNASIVRFIRFNLGQ
ncbi:MAG: elongation factor Ts [Chlorobi bacterium CHB2]|nr:elongation factor Ts [Chlorobi bacterium CHB2]